LGPAFHVRPAVDLAGKEAGDFSTAASQQAQIVHEAIVRSRDLLPRFAVFSLAPIALVIHLGFVFSDRVEVRTFQFDRDRCEWNWPHEGDLDGVQIAVTGLPDEVVAEECEVALRLSVSARVSEADARAAVPNVRWHVEVAVSEPSTVWLRSAARLHAVTKAVRETMTALRDRFPQCLKLHVFAAIPTPVAVAFGQIVNPRMDPKVALYEYSRQRSPRYRHVLTLEDFA
jgi:hypothetical protein